MDRSIRQSTLVAALLAAVSTAMVGQALGDVEGYAVMSMRNDDNLFRTASDAVDESIFRVGAGLHAELQKGQQRLELIGRIHDNQFETSEYLDYFGAAGELAFEWKVSDRLDGTLEYDYVRDLTSFEDHLLTVERDITTTKDAGAAIGFFLMPRLQLRGEARATGWRHSEENWRTSELDETEYGASVLFRTRAGSFIGVGTSLLDGEYPNRVLEPGPLRDNAYRQSRSDVIVEWSSGAKTSIDLRVGYASRELRHFSDRDFSATSGDIAFEYAPSPKTRLTALYSRGVRSIDEQVARAALVDVLELSPAWYATRDLAISAHVIYRQRDFIPIDGLPDDGRIDEEILVEGHVFYTIAGRFALEVGLGRGSRDSTRADIDFDYWYGSIGLRVTL